jgi:hypothetical protein
MYRKGIALIFIAFLSVIFLNSCLTTGDRVNMDEFKRQLEAGGTAMDVTQTAQVEAAVNEATAQETKVVAAAAVTQEPAKEATQEPATEPTAKPVVKHAPVVKAPAAKIEKQPAVKAKAAAPVKKEEPVQQAGAQGKGNNKLMLAAVFAAALAVFALIAFILTRKKREKEEEEILPGVSIKPVETAPEKAVEEYKETAALKQGPLPQSPEPAPQAQPAPQAEAAPEKQPEDAQEQAAEQAQKQVNEQTPAAAEKTQEPDNYSETTATVEASPQPPPAVPFPEKQSQYGEGIAGISPTQFAAGSQGNAVHLLYKVGDDSPEYRTIKITVPEGWSKPGTLNTDEGFFTASVNGGRLISTAAENMSMLITVYGLPAESGEVAVTFGERRGGSPGVKVQAQPGEAVFKIETEARGSTELKEILDSPVVDVN